MNKINKLSNHFTPYRDNANELRGGLEGTIMLMDKIITGQKIPSQGVRELGLIQDLVLDEKIASKANRVLIEIGGEGSSRKAGFKQNYNPNEAEVFRTLRDFTYLTRIDGLFEKIKTIKAKLIPFYEGDDLTYKERLKRFKPEFTYEEAWLIDKLRKFHTDHSITLLE